MWDARTPTKQAWMCCFWRYGWKNLQRKFLVFLISMQAFCLKSRKTQADTRVWCGTGAGGVCWKNAGIEEYLVTDLKRDFCKSMFVVYRLCHVLFILPTVEYMCKAFYDGGDGGRWWCCWWCCWWWWWRRWRYMYGEVLLTIQETFVRNQLQNIWCFWFWHSFPIMAGGWLVGWA